MRNLFSLGSLYVSDFLNTNEEPKNAPESLDLIFDENLCAARLNKTTNINKMFGKYWYRSGINSTMNEELKSIATDACSAIEINENDIFLDIACNDGTLLKHVPKKMIKMGIDPADETYVLESSKVADCIIQDYFSANVYKKSKFGHKKAKIITIIAMFYDLEEPLKFLQDAHEILDDEGLMIIQMSYTPLMLKQLAFDNICHEHVYYHSLISMQKLLKLSDFKIVDCILNDINGGSFRLYIRKNKSTDSKFKTSPFRDVANLRIESLLNQEYKDQINTEKPYIEFFKKIQDLKNETVSFIKQEKAKGKTIWAYGASTKGNTLLQWYGLDNKLIDGIAERSHFKFGLRTIGSNIPIYSEEIFREKNPNYTLILPWHFIHEFSIREKEYLNKGGKFIIPCPKFEIIEK